MTLSSRRHCDRQSLLVVRGNGFFPSSRAILTACMAVVMLFAGMASAAEIRPDQALTAVGNWLRYTRQRPLATPLSRTGDGVQSIRDEQGRALCHVVPLQNGGFVVTGGDDGVVPIVAFAAKGAFPSDQTHPLLAILHKDLPQRLAWAEERRGDPTTRQGAGTPDYAVQWQMLLEPCQATRGGIELPDDLRVAPLVQSTWGQSFIYSDNWEKITLYNYYTPSHYVTGCVATVGAQLLRYHEYPTAPVAARDVECKVDGADTTLTMFGGTYDWQNMPLRPDGSITLAQREAIGKLLYDVAVSVEMSFTEWSSAASVVDLSERLCDTFHFASAKYFIISDGDRDLSDLEQYEDMLLSNLDAGYPTAVGISGNQGGHAVVGDGYGLHNGHLYVHLNMGWDGSEDSWYNLPTVDTEQYSFSVFDELLFNAFPDFVGELITGRVIDDQGQPIAGAAVTAQNVATQAIVAEATTNERGIYALKIPAPAPAQQRYRVRAVFRGAEDSEVVDNVVTTYDYNTIYPAGNNVNYQIGSHWGVDLHVIQASYTVTFVLGDRARTDDGHLLVQQVKHGEAAIAPTVTTDSPWVFAGWDAEFDAVVGDMTVNARCTYRRDVALIAGWQVIGLDFIPDESCGAALAAENLTRYDAASKVFARQDGFVPGRAYWLFRQAPGTIILSGDIAAAPLLPSARGWHFVAVGADYDALPAGIAAAWQWRNGRYAQVYSLAMGEGYWLYCLDTAP